MVVLDHAFHGRSLLKMTSTAKNQPYEHSFLGAFAPEVYLAPMADPYCWPSGPDKCAVVAFSQFSRLVLDVDYQRQPRRCGHRGGPNRGRYPRRGRIRDTEGVRPEEVSLGKLDNVRESLAIARECRTLLGRRGITSEYSTLRHANNLEAVLTYGGNSEMQMLAIGKALTGQSAFSLTATSASRSEHR